ncbi:MAG: HIT family protein [Candidatus Pacebacteria bacterium]|jgi:histidine triad (HIT) family protein|nr:HIT family protein [Candidatus Paceibacterota bacterium]
METIFSKIINREIPAPIVYEDEHTLAFLDAHPVNLGHTLVVPKKHFRNLYDIDPETLSHVIKTVQKVAIALGHAVGAEGVNVHQNNESAAGQVVFHLHMHVIPRFKNDGRVLWEDKLEYRPGEASDLAEKIKSALV